MSTRSRANSDLRSAPHEGARVRSQAGPAPGATLPSGPYACMSVHALGVCLSIVVVPNARQTTVAGLHDGVLRLRLAAQAVDGRANAALLAWLAGELGLPKRGVVMLSGSTGRRKRVVVQSDLERVHEWLHAYVHQA